MNILEKLSNEFHLPMTNVESTVELIDDGNTIPFIARYRKEATGQLSDVILRDLHDRLRYLRNLEERKEEILRLIEEQGKLTEELRDEILKAEVLQRVEDLYKPFKQKKATRASKAKAKGLEPLADILWEMKITQGTLEEVAAPFVDMELGVETWQDAISGAADIVAERIADDPDLTAAIRQNTYREGILSSEGVDKEERTVYEMYYDYQEPVNKIVNHRILALNRGEKEKKLKVKLQAPVDTIKRLIAKNCVKNEASIFIDLFYETIDDAYKRLIAPSIEREIRNSLTERAEAEAVKVFAKNTEKLLMVPPVKGVRIISIDPGFRTGCKVAVLDETGKLLEYTTIYPTEPRNDTKGTEKTLLQYIDKYNINVIVIGNGTASRETELVVADIITRNNLSVRYTIVNEAGASIYSASKVATEEYPDLDVTTRGAMSIGRRLQDPLAELVKISPKHIGVGQYQHDINQGLLDSALTNVVEDCVNRVGVDLNTASPSLLAYIAGVNGAIAKNIVTYREEKGRFKDRKELKKVAKLGEKTYNQCVGFLRIAEGKNPLDSTSVHPESYKAAEAMIAKLNINIKEIAKGGIPDIEDKIMELYEGREKTLQKAIERMAAELDVGSLTLTDIVSEMKKPARDPREDAPDVVFRKDVLSFEDLKVGMELTGTVRNVVDFGAFVDIGVKNDGLVHISQITNRYIKHPMDVINVGDTVKVKILSIDPEKQKIGLTMKIE